MKLHLFLNFILLALLFTLGNDTISILSVTSKPSFNNLSVKFAPFKLAVVTTYAEISLSKLEYTLSVFLFFILIILILLSIDLVIALSLIA